MRWVLEFVERHAGELGMVLEWKYYSGDKTQYLWFGSIYLRKGEGYLQWSKVYLLFKVLYLRFC